MNWYREDDVFKPMNKDAMIKLIKLDCYYNELIISLACDYTNYNLTQVDGLFKYFPQIDIYYAKENSQLCFSFYWDDFEKLLPIALGLFSKIEPIDEASQQEMLKHFDDVTKQFANPVDTIAHANTTSNYSSDAINDYNPIENVNYSYDNKQDNYLQRSEEEELQAALALSMQTLAIDDDNNLNPEKHVTNINIKHNLPGLAEDQQLIYIDENEALAEALKRSREDNIVHLNSDEPKKYDSLLKSNNRYPFYSNPSLLTHFPNIDEDDLENNNTIKQQQKKYK